MRMAIIGKEDNTATSLPRRLRRNSGKYICSSDNVSAYTSIQLLKDGSHADINEGAKGSLTNARRWSMRFQPTWIALSLS